MHNDLKAFLEDNKIKALYNESLKNHTTFKVGGNRLCVVMPDTADKTIRLVQYLKKHGTKHYYIGNGSNIIFNDNGFDGVIIKSTLLDDVNINGFTVKAGAGVSVTSLARTLAEQGLSGLEFCYGIPGNVGGGVYMNCGAYNGQISDCIVSVEYIDETGRLKSISAQDCEFGYRHSVFMNNDWFIISATFKLKSGDKGQMLDYMSDIMSRRRDKQPLDKPSAGSSFKRPEGYFAAALIDQCGLKGMTVGGAQVSTKHAGFIVNIGEATCTDIISLADKVEEEVYRQTGVKLEKEMIIV